MRNISYMGRVVVKLIIIAIIAFVVITTAVFIINKYNQEQKLEESANSGSQVVEQTEKESDNKKEGAGKVTRLPGDTTETSNKSDETAKNPTETTKDSAETAKKPTEIITSSELPKTGPEEILFSLMGVALVAFSGTLYLKSKKAL